MRGVQYSLITLLAFAGCDSLNKPKVDNPVMGPPPPRYSFNNEPTNDGANPAQNAEMNGHIPDRDDSEVKTASLTETADTSLAGSQTVAVVNGSPILASEVLERYGTQLAEAKKQLPPEQFQQARKMLIKKDLNSHIERKLLADGLQGMLKKEQIEMLDNFINKAFDEEVDRMMKEADVNTRLELEQELRKQHTSLANLKTNFANQRMAMEYLGSKTKDDIEIGRPELLQYYMDHRDDYHVPARVKWKQILVQFQKHGGEDGAKKHLDKIIAKLRPTQGENFSEVAKEMSDGPNAPDGGRWGWIKQGSLADERIDKALFALQPGSPSQVYESADSYRIVMVEQREEGRYKPFNELQDEIKAKMESEKRKRVAQEFIEELKSEADITTIFDQSETQLANGPKEELPLRIR